MIKIKMFTYALWGKNLPVAGKENPKGRLLVLITETMGPAAVVPARNSVPKSVRGRTIFRHVDQDFLDGINLQTALNMEKYRQRQMIVEHPFGTIKGTGEHTTS